MADSLVGAGGDVAAMAFANPECASALHFKLASGNPSSGIFLLESVLWNLSLAPGSNPEVRGQYGFLDHADMPRSVRQFGVCSSEFELCLGQGQENIRIPRAVEPECLIQQQISRANINSGGVYAQQFPGQHTLFCVLTE